MNICDIIHYLILFSFVFILLLNPSLSIFIPISISIPSSLPALPNSTQQCPVRCNVVLYISYTVIPTSVKLPYHRSSNLFLLVKSKSRNFLPFHIYLSTYLSIYLSLNLFISISFSLSVSFFSLIFSFLCPSVSQSSSSSLPLFFFFVSSVLHLFISFLYSVSSNNFIRYLISSRSPHYILSCLF